MSVLLCSDFIEVNQGEIEQEANASRTTKAAALINRAVDPRRDNVSNLVSEQNPDDDIEMVNEPENCNIVIT